MKISLAELWQPAVRIKFILMPNIHMPYKQEGKILFETFHNWFSFLMILNSGRFAYHT